MDKRFCIFDMDGTLVNSMPAWKTLGETFLREHGIEPPRNLREIIAPLTMLESGEYFSTLGVSGTAQEIAAALNECIRRQYRTVIEAQPGVEKYLASLCGRGVRCCVATATDAALANECLLRLGLLRYFEFVASCEDIGVTKRSPDIYFLAAEKLGAAPCDTAVYEDVPYAAKTALEAGFYTVGYYDPACEHPQQQLKELCKEYITDYEAAANELPKEEA